MDAGSRSARACLLWLLGHLAAAAAGTLLTMHAGMSSPIWITNAIAIAALQNPPTRWSRALGLVATNLIGITGASALGHGGFSLGSAALFTVGDATHVGLATVILARMGGIPAFRLGFGPFLRFAVFATALPSLAGGVVGALIQRELGGLVGAPVWGWILAAWLGDLLVLPAIAALWEHTGRLRLDPASGLSVLLAAGLAAGTFVAEMPLFLLTLPVAAGAAVTAGFPGAVLTCLVTELVSGAGFYIDRGPFGVSQVPLATAILYQQLFAVGLTLSTLATATLLEERRRFEAALADGGRREREMRNRLEVALDGAQLGTWIWHAERSVLEQDRQFRRIFGFGSGPTPIDRTGWTSLLDPDDVADVQASYRGQREVNGDFDIECRLRRPDGSWFWGQVRGRVIERDADGNPLMVAGTLADITERRTADQRFRNIAENVEGLIYRLEPDEDGGAAVGQLTGRIKGIEIQPGEVERLIAEHWRATPPEVRWQLALKGQARHEVAIVRADGSRIWYRTSMSAAPSIGGRRSYDCVSVDITQEKLAEAKALAAEQRLRIAIDSIADNFMIYDAERRLVLWNDALLRTFPELQGLPLQGVADDAIVKAIVARNWQGQVSEPELAEWLRRHSDRAKYGHEWVEATGNGRWVRIVDQPLPDGGFVRIASDVTQLKLREAELERALGDLERANAGMAALNVELQDQRRRAEQASRHKSEFLAAMSHELRTPLNGVVGFAELLSATALSGEQQAYLTQLRQATEMLLAAISDILDFSKIESGLLELDPQPLDPAALVAGTADIVRATAADKGLELQVRLAPELAPRLRGDAGRVRQVLLNLLNNAVKFTDRGAVRVEARPLAGGTGLRVAVADTGIGIAPEQQERLFQHFTQADRSITRRFGGTGLGLAICRQLVELMGGTIGVDSEPGRGSLFWFELPLPVADPAADVAAPGPALSIGASGAHVLVVEDAPLNQALAAAMLQRAGYRVSLADDGEQGLAAALDRDFDLILMDVRMPRMDGLEATRRIRAAGGRLAALPIIGATADATVELVEVSREAGMDALLVKPLRAEELWAEVARQLQRSLRQNAGGLKRPA
jgi:PAS domain S-box-containing protein